MKHPWFKAIGLLYVPVSPAGWLATLLAAAWCAHVSGVVDAGSHSVSDTLYGVFPYVVPTLLALYLLALRTCRPDGPSKA